VHGDASTFVNRFPRCFSVIKMVLRLRVLPSMAGHVRAARACASFSYTAAMLKRKKQHCIPAGALMCCRRVFLPVPEGHAMNWNRGA
jgi:hypothetical protein